MKNLLSSVILTLISVCLNAQMVKSFMPLDRYSSKSKEMMQRLSNALDSEYPNLGVVNNVYGARWLCDTRANYLKKCARMKFFIKDEQMEVLLNGIIERIAGSNNLDRRDRMVLIVDDSDLNALCYSRGLFMLTVGLLARVHNEDELASILSHEIAHDELRHVQNNIIREADTKLSRQVNSQFKKVLSDNVTVEDILEFKKTMYKISAFSREKEIEADSLGLVLFRNAGYNLPEAVSALFTLDSAYRTTYELEGLFAPITFPNFEFRGFWLRPRASVFEQKPADSFLFSEDSLETHPELTERREIMTSFIDPDWSDFSDIDPAFLKEIVVPAQFESVEAAYRSKKHDKSLFQILTLMNKYPSNAYLVSRGAKILLDIAAAKNENLIHQYASRYTRNYSDELRLVNSFLYNISRHESAELAFNLLDSNNNFNNEEPSHYYLLWKACQLTKRNEVGRGIEDAYTKKFKKSLSSYEYQ